MRNKSFPGFSVLPFLARRSKTGAVAIKNKSRRLTLEPLEDRALLSLPAIPYGPNYEPGVVLQSTENSKVEPIALNLEVKTSTFNDGQVLSLTLNASKSISVWQIDWGDGSAPVVYEKLGDSLIVAHSYELQETEQEYVVVATLTDSDGYTAEEGYAAAFYTAPAKKNPVGTYTTEGTKTTFVTNNFYDAEKSSSSNSNLCWAAGASNALYYTGWASSESLVDASDKSESFESEDDVYAYFTDKFDNSGSSALYACKWFISGEYEGESISSFAQLTEKGGGFYTDVDADEVVEFYSYYNKSHTPETIMPIATEELEQGWGICASLGFFSGGRRAYTGSHTLSVWGYVCDENYSSDEPEYYTALIVSDPDDSKYRGRSAWNKLVTIQLEWSDTYDHYRVTDYSSSSSVWLEEFITVAPRTSVVATPDRATEASAASATFDVQRRAEENCFELLEELDDEEEDSYLDELAALWA